MSDMEDFAEQTSARLKELDEQFTRWLFKGQGSHIEYEPRVGEMRTRLAAAQERVNEIASADQERQAEIRQELADDITFLENELRLAWAELEERTDREQ
jgi:multidrug resistance efflux pump